MTTDPLARLKRAARNRERAEQEFRSALRAAYEAGHGFAELARLLGMARQSVRERLTRG